MSKRIMIGVMAAATLAITLALAANTIIVKQAFATGGNCGTCAFSFTPKTLSTSLLGTGQHGVQKIFAPGQEALASGASASSLSPGQLKP
jgi:hypothetical protein